MKKNILLLISDTGGGHRAAAQAVSEAIHLLYPNQFTLLIEDVLANCTPPPFKHIPEFYRWMTRTGLPLWWIVWRTLSQPTVLRHALAVVKRAIRSHLVTYFRRVQPDMVVSLHPLMNHIGLDCFHLAGLTGPFVTVVTDLLTIHPTWIDPRVTRCVVPTEVARQQAMLWGMSPEKVTTCGQPVSLKFAYSPMDKRLLRQRSGIEPDQPTILITGGGEGGRRLAVVAYSIARQISNAQLLIVAGRSHALHQELITHIWPIPTQIYGFVDNMPELMHMSDLIVTKAGPNTISEALCAALPILIFDFMSGQEYENVRYVRRSGAGTYIRNPGKIAKAVQELLMPDDPTLSLMAQQARQLAKPDASLRIAEEICMLIDPKLVRPTAVRDSLSRFGSHGVERN
ncbi:MAG: glycosyltransferase [Chloroflexota bacterium]